MKQPLRLSIIGAGRVGQTLGRLGQAAGYRIADVVCRSRRSAMRAVRFIGAGTPQAAACARLQAAHLIFIATPDNCIGEAARLLADNAQGVGRTVVLHTSGALSSEALNGLRAPHIAIASCHPLQTFESSRQALGVIQQSYFCVEGDGRAVRAARAFVRRIGARAFEIPTAMKPLYHAAAVLACGGLTALMSASLEALQHCGLSDAEARRVLLPLSEATLVNVRTVGPRRALTGPVRRGDVGTMRRNLDALAAIDVQWQAIYRLLAAQSLRLIAPQMDRATAEELQNLLTSDCLP